MNDEKKPYKPTRVQLKRAKETERLCSEMMRIEDAVLKEYGAEHIFTKAQVYGFALGCFSKMCREEYAKGREWVHFWRRTMRFFAIEKCALSTYVGATRFQTKGTNDGK